MTSDLVGTRIKRLSTCSIVEVNRCRDYWYRLSSKKTSPENVRLSRDKRWRRNIRKVFRQHGLMVVPVQNDSAGRKKTMKGEKAEGRYNQVRVRWKMWPILVNRDTTFDGKFDWMLLYAYQLSEKYEWPDWIPNILIIGLQVNKILEGNKVVCC